VSIRCRSWSAILTARRVHPLAAARALKSLNPLRHPNAAGLNPIAIPNFEICFKFWVPDPFGLELFKPSIHFSFIGGVQRRCCATSSGRLVSVMFLRDQS
jgi:hypothetical protein